MSIHISLISLISDADLFDSGRFEGIYITFCLYRLQNYQKSRVSQQGSRTVVDARWRNHVPALFAHVSEKKDTPPTIITPVHVNRF